MFRQLHRDARFGLRMLAKSPAVSFVAVLCLALGIGANTAIFSVLNSLLFDPLPYRDPDQLVEIYTEFPGSDLQHHMVSEPELADLADGVDGLDDMFAYTAIDGNVKLGDREPTERIVALVMGDNALATLGVKPALGRDFRPEEMQPGHETVVLLRHDLWQERFDGDPGVIGARIIIDTEPHEVIGVLPRGFVFPFQPEAKLFAPLAFHVRNPRANHYLFVIGRMKAGASLGALQSQLSALAEDLRAQYPEDYSDRSGFDFGAVSIEQALLGPVRPALYVLFGAVGFVLLIACANVASLLVARGLARHRELGLRAALGAGRGRLVRQMLTESVVLGLLGAGGGLLVALWGIDLLIAIAPTQVTELRVIAIDTWVLLFALGLSVVTGLLFGSFPAFFASRTKVHGSLTDCCARATIGVTGRRLRNVLVAAEVALALVLLIGAALADRSVAALERADLGFRSEQLLTMRLKLPYAKYVDPDTRLRFYESLFGQLETVGAGSHLPLASQRAANSCELEGFSGDVPPEADVRVVNGPYFEVMGIPIIAGRVFDDLEHRGDVRTAIVDELLASRYWPGGAVGKRIRLGHDEGWLTIVGVVGHVKDEGVESVGRPQIYLPYLSKPSLRMTLVVRTQDPDRVTEEIQAAVAALDPNLPLYDVKMMEERVGDSLAVQRFADFLLGLFAIIALGLAVIGIYAVMSFVVAGRTREIGIRMALGARPRQVVRMIVWQGMRVVFAGVAVGVVGAAAIMTAMSGLFYGVSPIDPLVYLGSAAAVTVAALVASFLAARRATRIDPVAALRAD